MIIEEGLALAELRHGVASMAEAAKDADVQIVTGDTKVVPRGSADKLFITTTGIGVIPAGITLGAHRARPGDTILVNGPIGEVTAQPVATVVLRTAFGGERIIDPLPGEQLPRIC